MLQRLVDGRPSTSAQATMALYGAHTGSQAGVRDFVKAMTGVGETSRDLLICSRQDAGGVLVAVADTGPALAAGALEQVFAAFYTTKPGGLGLGLSICRSIIEAHEGRLWASANDPHGARFEFTLPVRPDGDR
jgi:signal transduction histidine kinase